MLVLAQIPEAQLLHETLGETFLDREGVVLRPFVLAVVVHPQSVVRYGVVVLELGEGDFLRLLIVAVLFLRRSAVVKHGILLQLLADSLLQFLNRQLDELYGLNLERGESLYLFKT